MPADDYYHLSDADLGAVIAYLKSLPPVDSEQPDSSVGPLARALNLAGQFPLFSAERIDHTGPRPTAPPAGPTAEYGKYLVSVGCAGCHGPGLSGGPVPSFPPDAPPALNLTSGGEMGVWSEADFFNAMRTGVNPAGRELDSEWMPWPAFKQLTDEELRAIWLHLQSVPAREYGNR